MKKPAEQYDNCPARTVVLKTPLDFKDIQKLKAGDIISLSGRIFSARDAAHKRIVSAIAEGYKTSC